MQLSREDIVLAAENINLIEDDYNVRETYMGRDGAPGVGVAVPNQRKLMELLVGLAVVLTEAGRGEDALDLATRTRTDSMGLDGVIVYWGGVELAD